MPVGCEVDERQGRLLPFEGQAIHGVVGVARHVLADVQERGQLALQLGRAVSCVRLQQDQAFAPVARVGKTGAP